MRSLTPHSPAGPGAGLVPGIGPRVGTINCAPESFHAHIRERFLVTLVTPPSPPHSYTACVLSKATEGENQQC